MPPTEFMDLSNFRLSHPQQQGSFHLSQMATSGAQNYHLMLQKNVKITALMISMHHPCFQAYNRSSPLLFIMVLEQNKSDCTHQQSLPAVQSQNSFQSQSVMQSKLKLRIRVASIFKQTSSNHNLKKIMELKCSQLIKGLLMLLAGNIEHSTPPEEQADEEGDQRGNGDSMAAGAGGAPSEDGYNWRKYGQKQVKGRSHNHPKPPPNRRSGIGSVNLHTDIQVDNPEHVEPQNGGDNDLGWANVQKGNIAGTANWKHDNLEVTSSASVGPEYCNQSTNLQTQNSTHFDSGDAVDASSTFSNEEDEDDQGTHGSVSLGYDGEGDESESKRRKLESYATELSGATRAIREPRVVVQTTSEVDILDDGYRWRKYGQKVVKGIPTQGVHSPLICSFVLPLPHSFSHMSYYKCTNAGCTVRKHVERASHDLKSVITTYEGKHNHDVPAARASSHVNANASNTVPGQASGVLQTHVHRPEPSQVHNGIGRLERPSLGSFSLPGRQQLGPSHGFSFGMNQPMLSNLAMSGLGPAQAKLPVMPVHPFLAQQRPANEMGFMLPKGEPNVGPIPERGLNLPSGSSVYQRYYESHASWTSYVKFDSPLIL
ncbi:WRKY domain [Sesbania bispinosa]|nr:WRKY domain [Sesbania bispinosa]